MSKNVKTIVVTNGFGGHLNLRTVRFGVPGGRPKVYIQAGTHTEELPGPLVVHHLEQLLTMATSDEEWSGEVILVPFSNPIGLTQAISGNPAGRSELTSGLNFNGSWPSLPLPEDVTGVSPAAQLDNAVALTTLGQVRLELLRLAHDADIVLDLHCAMYPAISFAFMKDRYVRAATPLASALNLEAVFTLASSSLNSFDDVIANIQESYYPATESLPRVVATIELRSNRDVADSLAREDALGLKNYLCQIGVLKEAVDTASDWTGILTPYSETIATLAECGGIFIPKAMLRENVKQGELLGEILSPMPISDLDRIPIVAPCDGFVLSHADSSKIMQLGDVTYTIIPSSDVGMPPRAFIDISDDWL